MFTSLCYSLNRTCIHHECPQVVRQGWHANRREACVCRYRASGVILDEIEVIQALGIGERKIGYSCSPVRIILFSVQSIWRRL